MGKRTKQVLAFLLILTITAAYVVPPQTVAAAQAGSTAEETGGIAAQADAAPTVTYNTVHDPSIVVGYIDGAASAYTAATKVYGEQNAEKTRTEMYFIFGSHRAWSYSFDLANWKTFTNNINTDYDTLFAEDAKWSALGGIQGSETGKYEVGGNLWAPDVVWNPNYKNADGSTGAWCMYMSVNGDYWYTSVVLLTAASLNGDWTRVGPVVYSGFANADQAQKTDYFSVKDTGGNALAWDERYIRKSNGGQLLYGMNAIDPCVFFDNGDLWMTYGSWFGGIYMIKLDPATGSRDYATRYALTANTSDPYMGYKIAGGEGSSGEASYIEKIGEYYYLFMSYGGFVANGGYNMRVFRSKTVTGPYVDESGDDARYTTGVGNKNINGTVGMRLMTYYKWNYMKYGYTAQGHNSQFVDDDGRAYVIYHTRTTDGSEGHSVRVHQLFVTENGWLAAAPFEYTGEALSADLTEEDVRGSYEVIFHGSTNYDSLECAEGKTYEFTADHIVNFSGSNAGTWNWSQAKGAPYVNVVIDGKNYEGVFVEQYMETSTAAGAPIETVREVGEKTMAFTLVGDASSETAVWGYRYIGGDAAIAQEAVESLAVPSGTFMSLSLPSTCTLNVPVQWKSNNTALMTDDGILQSVPEEDKTVTLTASITYNGCTASCDYKVVVYAPQNDKENKVIARYFTDSPADLTNAGEGTYRYENPFLAEHAFGLQAYNGVSIKFDLTRTSDADPWLKDILEFGTGTSGGLYFDGNSYLGYNATGGIFDANLRNGSFGSLSWGWGTDYLALTSGKKASVEIQILPTGYSVSVNGTVVYTQDDIEPYKEGQTTYKTPGQNGVDDYTTVLNYILTTATQLNFGWGDWWDGGYPGTISNVECSALPVEVKDTSGYIYYEDFNGFAGTSGDATGLISASAKDNVSVVYSADQHGYYLDYKGASLSGNRGAYKDFGLNGSVTGNYTFEADVKMRAGTDRLSSFALAATGASVKGNDEITSNYILKLAQTANNTTTYKVNDSETTVNIPNETWIHITVAVDDANNVYADIGGTLVKTTANGNTVLYGLYLLKARSWGAFSVDNLALKDTFTCIHGEESWTQSTETVKATCTQPGGYKVTCSVCGWEGADGTTPALGHEYTSEITPPTCTEEGYTTYTCIRGDHTYKANYTKATGHLHTEIRNSKDATCTENGYTGDTYCKDCEALIATGSVIEAEGHSYGDPVIKEPTCETKGSKTFTCSVCGNFYTEEIEALGHDWQPDTSKDGSATCTESGTGYFTCSRCHEVKTVDGQAPLGHSWDQGTVKKAATCTEDGVMVYTCTRECCKDVPVTREEHIPATGHDYEEKVTAPTCTEKGFTTHTCKKCNHSYIDSETAAAGHDYEDQVTAATCIAQGYTTHTCKECGDSYVDSYTHMTDHRYDEGVVVKEATSTETGIIRYTCSMCGSSYTKTIAKLPQTTPPAENTPAVKLSRVSVKSVINTGAGVKITWAKAASAKGYYIYRKTGNGKYTRLASVSGQNKVSYTDRRAANGKTYTYRVCAYNGRVTGAFGTAKKTLYLSKVKLSGIKNSKPKKLMVQYKKNTKGSGYQIQYSTSKKFKSAKKVTVKSSKKLKATLKSLKKKKTYYVRVRVYKKSGKQTYYSEWSNIKSKKVTK